MIFSRLRFKVLLYTLFLCIVNNYIFSESLTGKELTEKVSEFLTSQNISHSFSPLVSSEDGDFPENITVLIESSGEDKNSTSIKNVVFAFTQEHFMEDPNLVFGFISGIKELNLPYNSVILLSACDNNVIFEESTSLINGTKQFVSSIENIESYCAVCFTIQKGKRKSIFYSGTKEISPLWIINTLNQCTRENGISTNPTSSFFYKIKPRTSRIDRRTDFFLTEGIPSAGISVTESDLNLMLSIAEKTVSSRNDSWDRHYIFTHIGKKVIFFNEASFIFIFILFSTAVLFSLCFSSFFTTSNNFAKLEDLKRTFFLIPAVILLTTLILFFGQFAFSFLKNMPAVLFGIKLFFTCCLTFLILLIQLHYNFFISYAAFSYQMLIVSAFNIFIFSALDISLMFIFFAEYIILLFVSKRKNKYILSAGFILSLLPFVYLEFKFFSTAHNDVILRFVNSGFSGNVLTALVIFPFQLQWIRLILSFGLTESNSTKNRKTLVKKYSAAIVISLSVLVLMYSLALFISTDAAENSTYNIPLKVNKELPAENFQVQLSKSNFFNLQTNTITIKSEGNIIRYKVQIKNQNSLPVFESNFDYLTDSSGAVSFILPDYPGNNIEIIFTSEKDSISLVEVTAYVKDENQCISRQVFSGEII